MNGNDGFRKLKREIIDKELCTKCGTCIGVCPVNYIVYKEGEIQGNDNECISCGKCLKNCPGKHFDYNEFNHQLFETEYDKEEILGTYKKIYIGQAVSEFVRGQSASGGIVSEIAAFLLKNRYVDGIVVITSKGNKRDFEVKIARSEEEVYNAAQSKYVIVPTNEILKVILKEEGKFAYIGLPCQIQGVRKAISNNAVLKEKIFIVIGLFCGFNMEQGATDYLIKKSKIKSDEIKELSYRKKQSGSTGFYICDNEKEFFVKKHEYTFLNLFYAPKRCLMCYDYSAEFSDISVGDAWERDEGWSRIIVRSDLGKSIIEELHNSNAILLEESNRTAIEDSQIKIINHKKRDIWFRWTKYKNIPEINIGEKPEKVKIDSKAKIQYLLMSFGNTNLGRKLLYLIPFGILRKISGILRR